MRTARGKKTSQVELVARVMDEARKGLEFVIVQDPWFSQLDWGPKKKTKRREQEKPKGPIIC